MLLEDEALVMAISQAYDERKREKEEGKFDEDANPMDQQEENFIPSPIKYTPQK